MNRDLVYKYTLEYFNGDSLATNIWIDKYCLKSGEDYLESSPDDMHRRSAKELARIEQKYPNPLSEEEIYNLLKDFKYILLGGSINYGIGNPYSISSLGNCFVIDSSKDSYGGIFNNDQEQAQLMKRRAGVGHDLSNIRPARSKVSNAAGSSTGILPFMERFSNTTREVAQDGRRGALMLSIDISHPESERFITAKDDLTKITGANISVKIDNSFMEAVERDIFYPLIYLNGDWKPVKAKELWNKLIHQAWKSAEPGVLFWDNIINESIPSCYGEEWKEKSTNPCGEIPLCPYDSCRLLSVNLYSFVEYPFESKFSSRGVPHFNYDKFKDVVYKAQRLMDDVVDLEEEKINLILNKIENDPEPEEIKKVEQDLWIKIKTKLLAGRRTGLSAIGLADCLAALNRGYATDESIELAEEIYKQFSISAYKSSIDMARDRGAFPIWNKDKEFLNPFIQRFIEEIDSNPYIYSESTLENYYKYGRRNIALLTIPPSGTISMMGKISSGIEPVYQLYYKRRYKILENTEEKKAFDFVDQNGDKWKEYIVWHPKFVEWYIKASQCEHCPQIALEALQTKDEKLLQEVIKISPFYKSTSYEIDPIQRVKLQGAIQKWIDHSISSTINLSEDTKEEQVSNIYMQAWKEGLKGVTIYRNNCRTGVLVDIDKKDTEFKQHDAPKRPEILPCEIYKTKSKGREWNIVVGLYDNKPYEVFVTNYNIEFSKGVGDIIKVKRGRYDIRLGNEGYIENVTKDVPDDENMLTRMISTALRHGSSIKFIVEQLNKSTGDITSFSHAVARILKKYIKDGIETKEVCPECGSKLIYQNGCKECSRENNSSCSYSKCE
jgi:ribonucleoside-diphosphate reductase alpha chain